MSSGGGVRLARGDSARWNGAGKRTSRPRLAEAMRAAGVRWSVLLSDQPHRALLELVVEQQR